MPLPPAPVVLRNRQRHRQGVYRYHPSWQPWEQLSSRKNGTTPSTYGRSLSIQCKVTEMVSSAATAVHRSPIPHFQRWDAVEVDPVCRGPKVGPLTDTAGSAEKEESLGAGLVSLVLKIGFWFWAIPISTFDLDEDGLQEGICEGSDTATWGISQLTDWVGELLATGWNLFQTLAQPPADARSFLSYLIPCLSVVGSTHGGCSFAMGASAMPPRARWGHSAPSRSHGRVPCNR